MIIGICGVGVVGGALKRLLQKNPDHDVRSYDPVLGLDDKLSDCDAIFICVPVPTRTNRTQDYSIVEKLLAEKIPKAIPTFLRSTVIPGTTDALATKWGHSLWFMPEFLTERTADLDVSKQPIVCGSTGILYYLVKEIFPDKEIIYMTNKEAEFSKYVHNCFGATKVTYFNWVYKSAKANGLNYSKVLKGALSSGLIEETHTQVPGPDGQFGYGGKCLPKDLSALIGWGGVTSPLLSTVESANIMNRRGK